MVAKHVIFEGRVQGVGFRFTALRIANRYGLTGWVRNVPDGTVEMLAQGGTEDVNHCLQDIQESFEGYITQTRTRDSSEDTKYVNFRITY